MHFDLSTIDPNIIYLLFVFGLWVCVTAVYVSGTRILETLAFASIGISLVALAQRDTNWLAVLLLMAGVSAFMVAPFIKQQITPMAVGGLVLQAVGGLLLIGEAPGISPFIVMVSLILPFAYNQLILLPLLEHASRQPVNDRDNNLVGMRGRVVKALDPIGTARVGGELWTALLDDEDDDPDTPHVLESGEQIVVLERRGLQLMVEPLVKRKRQMEEGLPTAPVVHHDGENNGGRS